ncbi:MAG: peptide ABC transporter substrate-binding protein [Acidimicrobiia bacterium]
MQIPHRRAAARLSLLTVLVLLVGACAAGDATDTTGDSATTSSAPSTTTTTQAPPSTVVGDCPDAFCVKYNIHPDAAWADGEPVTASDFAFTYDTIMNDQLDITSRDGYDKMTGYSVVDDKTFLAIFGEVYAPWQNLFSTVLPEHEMAGKPFNSYWDQAVTLGSGPFEFVEWVPNERLVLQRNPNYWADKERGSGLPLGDVQTINYVFIEDSQTMVQALKGQEVDFINPQPQVSLAADVDAIDGVDWQATLGNVWEHFDFNHSDPLLSQKFIRQAIAQGIDRDSIVEAIVRPLNPDAELLGSSVWMTTSAYYEDHFNEKFPYDPAAAEQLLVDNGCTKGSDGIYECGGQRLSFRWTTTAGNEGRELQFELSQANLAQIGIEVVPAFGPASEVFADEYFYGDSQVWQIFNFGWVGNPDPSGGNTLYYCEGDAPSGFGGNNNLRLCDEQVDQLIHSTDAIVDPAARAAVYNQADELFLDEVALIPMYQKPQFLAWNSTIQGVMPNPNNVTDTWNVGAWSGKEDVIFGAEQEPESLNPLEPDGNLQATSFIDSAILEGAYTNTPDGRYVPVLIESAEPIVPAG